MRLRRARPDLEVGPGERLLVWARGAAVDAGDGGAGGAAGGDVTIGGTRDALYLPERIPWEQVKAADWDQESGRLRVSEVGSWGQPRRAFEFALEDPGRLLQLTRERITASVVLQRHVPVAGKRGFRVMARRAPGRPTPIEWFLEYDPGIDPEDPEVALVAGEALALAREEVSLS